MRDRFWILGDSKSNSLWIKCFGKGKGDDDSSP